MILPVIQYSDKFRSSSGRLSSNKTCKGSRHCLLEVGSNERMVMFSLSPWLSRKMGISIFWRSTWSVSGFRLLLRWLAVRFNERLLPFSEFSTSVGLRERNLVNKCFHVSTNKATYICHSPLLAIIAAARLEEYLRIGIKIKLDIRDVNYMNHYIRTFAGRKVTREG